MVFPTFNLEYVSHDLGLIFFLHEFLTREKIMGCKVDNEQLIKAHERLARVQEKKVKVNAVIRQSLYDLQK